MHINPYYASVFEKKPNILKKIIKCSKAIAFAMSR